jgi:hypothetical protein
MGEDGAEEVTRLRGMHMIPMLRDDGYLPEGLHLASEAEVLFRFGSSTPRRRRLASRVRRWIGLLRSVGAVRLLIDGSFITSKPEPQDVDAVAWLPVDFHRQIKDEVEAALELEQMLLTRHPEELFGAEDDFDWKEWIEFFSRTRESDGRRKGLVEVQL